MSRLRPTIPSILNPRNFCREAQSRFALPRLLLATLAIESVSEDLSNEAQTILQRFWPVSRFTGRLETYAPKHWPAACCQGETNGCLDRVLLAILAINRCFWGKLRSVGNANHPVGHSLRLHPRKLVGTKQSMRDRMQAGVPIKMSENECSGPIRRNLPQRRMLDLETLADSALRVFDFAVDLIGRNIHEPCRDVGHQRLKAQALLQFDLQIRS
jgi:hypothetical protein